MRIEPCGRMTELRRKRWGICSLQEKEGYYLVWSNASDPNDGSPRKCNLYRSKQPLNATNLESAEMEEIDLGGKKAGEEITVELIKPEDRNTVDYYALTSMDTWGNTSGLSNVVEIRWADFLPKEEPDRNSRDIGKRRGCLPEPHNRYFECKGEALTGQRA